MTSDKKIQRPQLEVAAAAATAATTATAATIIRVEV
jgi:hypothetical protein